MNFEQDVLLPVTWTVLFVLTTLVSVALLIVGQLIWVLRNGWFLILLGLMGYVFKLQAQALTFF